MAISKTQSLTKFQSSSFIPTHGNSNPTWEHFSLVNEQGKDVYVCLYYGGKLRGSGIHRMKHHLVGKTSQISSCKKVPHGVHCQMRVVLDKLEKRRNMKKHDKEATNKSYGLDEELENIKEKEVQDLITLTKKRPQTPNKGKRKRDDGVDLFFALRITPSS